MDKSELAIIVTAIVGAMVTIATGLGRLAWRMFNAWLLERAADRTTREKAREEDRAQTKEQTIAMSTLSHRLESVEKALDRVEVRVERVSGVHDVPHDAAELAEQETQPKRTRATPAKGVGQYRLGRARTEPAGG
jgi:hypothetical protein